MRQTTDVKDQNPAAPLLDAGLYDYDLPVTRAAGPPPHPRPVWRGVGPSIAEGLGIFVINFGAQYLHAWGGWRLLHCYMLVGMPFVVLKYWSGPRPQQNFPRWFLKVVGIGLNCYVGFVTVPESLRGLLPETLAFGLPAFLTTAAFYFVAPVRPDTGKKVPLWQWLLVAGWAAAVWVWFGPNLIK